MFSSLFTTSFKNKKYKFDFLVRADNKATLHLKPTLLYFICLPIKLFAMNL